MNLLKALGTVSGFTLLSRVTGLARDVIMASVFGASALADAFFIAFRIPNLLRRIFAEGAFIQAFVPTLARKKEAQGIEKTKELIDAVGCGLFWALLLITIVGVLGAPAILWVMADGIAQDPATFAAMTTMTRWMFPYILLISLVAFASGILNTWRQFALPAFTPVLLNCSFIVAALFLAPYFNPPIYALAAGVILGGFVQLAIQIPALMRIGMLPKISLNPFAPFKDPEVRNILMLMAPILLSVSVAQISLIINTKIASHLGPGVVSWITYADRLMEFPTAMLGVALGVVLTPSLSAAHQRKDAAEYSALLDWGLRLCVLMSLPAMIGLMLLSQPITAMLFHSGKFSDLDVINTATVTSAYGLGIVGLVAIKILAPGFFARQDTKTPVKIAIVVLIFTQLANWVLVPLIGHSALALSISLGALLNAAWMLIALRRTKAFVPSRGWLGFVLPVLAASFTMAFALAMVEPAIDWAALQSSPFKRFGLVSAVIVAAAAIYFGTLMLLDIDLESLLRKKTAINKTIS